MSKYNESRCTPPNAFRWTDPQLESKQRWLSSLIVLRLRDGKGTNIQIREMPREDFQRMVEYQKSL